MREKQLKRHRIHRKIRAKIFGTKDRPRLCVFRSANHIYAQLIDDEKSKVLAEVSDLKIKKDNLPSHKASARQGKINRAMEVGKLIAKEATKKNVEKVVFDRGGFVFHGRVKALAEGAREGGLKF